MRKPCLALVIAVIRVSGSFSLNEVTLVEPSRWTIHPAGQTAVLQSLNSTGRRDQGLNHRLSVSAWVKHSLNLAAAGRDSGTDEFMGLLRIHSVRNSSASKERVRTLLRIPQTR